MPTNSRARTSSLAVMACSLLGLAGCGAEAPLSQAGRPNILLLSVDTLRADHLGYHGYERPTSPRLDAFAETATVFENAQASSSWTLPTLASIFSSTYVSTHGCWSMGKRLDESFTTFPELLTAAGYDSLVVANHLLCGPKYGISQGFVHNDFKLCDLELGTLKTTTSKEIADKGIRFLEQKAAVSEPGAWMLWLHFFDPHYQYMAQEGYTETFDRQDAKTEQMDLYDGEIALTDAHLGRVLDVLEASGLADNTVVFFFSDHGEEFLEHGGKYHGVTLYSEMLHIPLMMRRPGQEGQRIASVVRTVDLMPTVLELVGLPIPNYVEGSSLIPLVEGRESEPRLAFSEAGMRGREPLSALREERFKWIQLRDGSEGWLYDLESDPGETLDVAAEHPEVVQRLKSELKRIRESSLAKSKLYSHSTVAIPPSEREDLNALGYTEEEDED